MRRLSCVLLAALMGVACAAKQSVLPRTLWERKIRTEKRRMQTPNQATSSTDELRSILNINEGSVAAFSAVFDNLFKSIDFAAQVKPNENGEPNPLFNKMFSTFKILQQSPAYQDALESGADLTDSATQAKVLSDAVAQFANLAVNLRVSVDEDKQATGGINGKVLDFLAKGDAATVALADRVQAGDSGAIRELQQSFMDEAYPGLKLDALMDDDFVRAARAQLSNDEGLKALVGDENTLDLLLDDELLFANNPIYKGEL